MVAGITVGVVAFLIAVVGMFFGIRRFLKKYRAQRVARKKMQTESNDMPELPTYSTVDPGQERGM